jgi:hypothetical protein
MATVTATAAVSALAEVERLTVEHSNRLRATESEAIDGSKATEAVQHKYQQPDRPVPDLFYGSDLPERPSPTSVRLVCIQVVWPLWPLSVAQRHSVPSSTAHRSVAFRRFSNEGAR